MNAPEASGLPALSVVMPSLNQARYLRQAVHSVLGQGGDELELVVQDGGSSDGSQALLAELQAAYGGRLRWRSEADQGPADAIHRAVLRARAPLIGWLNSDDLYAPGAIERARRALDAHPEWVMVYGHGEHVDAAGAHLEPYPTQPPAVAPEAFLAGCFICQPTVFFRRAAYLALGGLDPAFRASFDFEFWIRVFRAHPSGIGFVDALQASTRLHDAAITATQRERVAVEGMRLLQRHFGHAPAHWLLTHFDELAERHPFHDAPMALAEAMRAALAKVHDTLDAAGLAAVSRRFEDDVRVRTGSPALGLGLHPDGWAGPRAEVRVWQPAKAFSTARLAGWLAPHGTPATTLTVVHPHGREDRYRLEGPGRFELAWGLQDLGAGQQGRYQLLSGPGFVPARLEPGSSDQRELVLRVDHLDLR